MAFNLLIVDDSKTVRAVIRKSLRLAKIPTNEVHEAENGQQALEVVASKWIDLILLDINMPVMNGVETIEHLAGDEVHAGIPIIIVSSEGSKVRLEQLMQGSVRGYVRKPFHPEELRDVLYATLGEPQ